MHKKIQITQAQWLAFCNEYQEPSNEHLRLGQVFCTFAESNGISIPSSDAKEYILYRITNMGEILDIVQFV